MVFQTCFIGKTASSTSINSDLQVVPYRQLLPSFAYAPALLNHFDSSEAIDQMFEHIEQTYLSVHYVETREWVQFIRSNTTPALIAGWLGDFFDGEFLRPLEYLAGMDKKTDDSDIASSILYRREQFSQRVR